MSRVLILGGNGMIGHSLYVNLKKEFEVFATFQGEKNTYANFLFFDTSNCFYNHNALETESFKKILKDINLFIKDLNLGEPSNLLQAQIWRQ